MEVAGFAWESEEGYFATLAFKSSVGLDLVSLAKDVLRSTTGEKAYRYSKDKDVFGEVALAMVTTEEVGGGSPGSPTSRFTAVNGKEVPNGVPNGSANGTNIANGASSSRRSSDARSNGHGQPRITPPGQEKLTITTTTTQRDDWAPPVNGHRQPYHPSNAYSEADVSHKRKRSGSVEHHSSSAASYHSHPIPSSTKQTPTTATADSDTPRDEALRGPPQTDNMDLYSQDGHYRSYGGPSDEKRDHSSASDHWHGRPYQQQSHHNSDEHIGEVIQRANQSMDAQKREYGSPGDDDRSANPYSGGGYDRREMSAQSDPKKRKRNFSNRTKTGCMTCRRRKKKCDETRPECKLSLDPLSRLWN